MSTLTWTASKYNGSTYSISMPNIQYVSLSNGKRNLTDSYQGLSLTMSGHTPSALPSLSIGTRFRLNSSKTIWYFRVADFIIEYGKVPAEDTWTIIGEAGYSLVSKATASTFLATGPTAFTTADWLTACGYTADTSGFGQNYFDTPNINITSQNGATVLNTLVAGDLNEWYEYDMGLQLGSHDGFRDTPYVTFTDTGPTSTKIAYSQLQFASLSQSYATKVTVSAFNGTYVATSGAGNRNWQFDTYNSSLADAQSIADRAAATLSLSSNFPTSVSYVLERQNTTLVNTFDAQIGALGGYPILLPVPFGTDTEMVAIEFRGATYYAGRIGMEVNATPDSTEVTYWLAPSSVNAFFTLDSTTLGVLDTNRLGF